MKYQRRSYSSKLYGAALHAWFNGCYVGGYSLSLFYFRKNYTIVIEIILFAISILYKIKISHSISLIYSHLRPTQAIETFKIYITKSHKTVMKQ